VQRSGDIRKWAFGVMQITGEEGKELIVSGAWLMRGDTVKHLCDANDDANWYVAVLNLYTLCNILRAAIE
jgi:elongation factor 1-gamma